MGKSCAVGTKGRDPPPGGKSQVAISFIKNLLWTPPLKSKWSRGRSECPSVKNVDD